MFLVFLDYRLRYIYAEIEYIWGKRQTYHIKNSNLVGIFFVSLSYIWSDRPTKPEITLYRLDGT